jgi:hypothetical protein
LEAQDAVDTNGQLVLPVKTKLKVCVLTSTGNAGKTTSSAYFLVPRLSDAVFMSVESINQSAVDWGFTNVQTFTGSQFGDVITEMVLEDDRPVVLDVGASNIESLFAAMGNYAGAVDEFDLFIIPAIADKKSLEEAAKIIEQLHVMGVPSHKILLLPNRVSSARPEVEFGPLFKYIRSSGKAIIDPAIYVPESSVFADLMRLHMTIETLLDGTNYRELATKARATGDADAAFEYAQKYVLCRHATLLKDHLDKAFRVMWKKIDG